MQLQKQGQPEQRIMRPSYLLGISHSWFLLKLTEVMMLLLVASNMSSGIKVACLSLSKKQFRNKTFSTVQKICNLYSLLLKAFTDFTNMFMVSIDEALWGQNAPLMLGHMNKTDVLSKFRHLENAWSISPPMIGAESDFKTKLFKKICKICQLWWLQIMSATLHLVSYNHLHNTFLFL